MKVYTITRILKNAEQKEYFNEVVKVFANLEEAKVYCENSIARDEEIRVEHYNESRGVESYIAEWKGWKKFTDFSSETYRIKEMELN